MKSLVCVAAIAAAALAQPTAAQAPSNSKSPWDVVADTLDTSNSTCEAIYRGNAEALQDTTRLRADVLKLYAKPAPPKRAPVKPGADPASGGCGELERIEADGNVFYVSPQQKARSNHAVYVAGSTTITMTGDVVAVQGKNVLRGERMVFNTDSGEGHVEGTAKGRGAKDRPRGVFYPSQSNATSTADKPK